MMNPNQRLAKKHAGAETLSQSVINIFTSERNGLVDFSEYDAV